MSAPELSIIIVNWNGEKLLPDCLGSIAEHPPTSAYEVIVVDNASTDQSIAWLESDGRRRLIPDERFRLIKNSENLGFGAANNIAFKVAASPVLFLLNPDAKVLEGTCDGILTLFATRPEIEGVAPLIRNADLTIQKCIRPALPSPLTILAEAYRLHRLMTSQFASKVLMGPHWHYSREEFIPLTAAAGLALRRRLVETIGGFDESFHMYGEDDELCARIWKRGQKLLFSPSIAIVHLSGSSSKTRWTVFAKAEVQERAFLRYQRRTCSRGRIIANASARLIVVIPLLFKYVFSQDSRRMFFRMACLNLRQILYPASLETENVN